MTEVSRTEKQVVGGGYHKPVCVACSRELRPEKNGIGILDMVRGKGYELWDADKWKCPACGIEVIGGFGQGPVRSHFEDRFAQLVDSYRERENLTEVHYD